MKLQKYILAAAFFSVFTIAKAQDSTFTISGNFEKIKKGTVILNIYENDKTLHDTAPINDGQFKFTGNVSSPYFATLTMKRKQDDFFSFYIEPTAMEISGRGDSLKLLTVKGSSINDDDKLLKDRMKYITKWQEANSKLYEKAYKEKNREIMDSLDEVDFDVLAEKRKVVSSFVKENPSSLRGAMAITENYGYYAEAEDIAPLYDTLSPGIKNSEKGKDIKNLLNTYRSVEVGRIAPDITQSTPEGKQLSLSSLRGQYVLIDFWASWCGPCRRENPNVVSIYKKYKNDGFTILGVSYDSDKSKWQKAISDDNLEWNQVSDLQAWQNSTSDQYGIKAIPSNVLIDKDGKIIAKNIFGKKLKKELSKIFDH